MRQADSTIKGYLYQFNKSILEILNSDEDASITLEGVIEDIDISSTHTTSTIQCKYHEEGKFTLSSVAAPILEMVCHFNECKALGKDIKYVLYAYYSVNTDNLDKEAFVNYISKTNSKDLIIGYFHRIFKIPDHEILSLANKSKKTQKDKDILWNYYQSNRSQLTYCIDWNNFWQHFKYIKAVNFETLKEDVIHKLCENTNRETAENLYYPNAFSIVANYSAKSDESERTIIKQDFFKRLKSMESVLITKWMLAAMNKNKILQTKKQHLASNFSLNPAIRAFVFSKYFLSVNEDKIIPFIQEYISKYYRKKTLHKPPLFIFENDSIMQKLILGLYNYQQSVNSGLVCNEFFANSFIHNTDCSPDFVCKVISLINVNIEILEACKVNQLYIIGEVNTELNSSNYYTEQIEIDELNVLRYLINLEKTLEG